MKRLTALPSGSYRLNPTTLRLRFAQQSKERKNTAVTHRKFVLATCARLRREMKTS